MRLILSALIFFSGFLNCIAFAQERDSTDRNYKNTIRFNLSAPIIFSNRYLVFGYERILPKNQSFSISVGRFGLPDFVDRDSIRIKNTRSDRSFHISADYRFYLQKENKYRSPHGVYIGPYINYNWLSRDGTWSFSSSDFREDVHVKTDMNFFGVGAELGYQFVLWQRLALDFVVVGPGIARYSIKPEIETELSATNQGNVLNAVFGRLQKALPGVDKILNNDDFVSGDGVKTWAFGYRYIFHIGYRF